MRRLAVFLATCGYIGYAPVAPGTFGSAAGLAIFALLRASGSTFVEIAAIAAIYAVGIWSASETERYFDRTDPGPIVLDEVLGMLITLALLPVNTAGAIVGFLLFRALDVVKPWPSRQFEQLHGGLGVMSDDAMAAVYGNVIMRILLALVPVGWLS